VKLGSFDYLTPSTPDEAVSLLGQYGDDAKVLAGGQSLVPLLAMRLANPSVVIDLNGVNALSYLDDRGDALHIGALARHRMVEQLDGTTDRCAAIGDAICRIGHVAIRNRGTVVGSITHADPAAEWPALALMLDAHIEARGPNGVRSIPAESFFLGYLTTVLDADEMVTDVSLPLPGGRAGSSCVELARRFGDFAVVGITALVRLAEAGTVDDARIVVFGAGPTPLRIADAEKALLGRPPEAAALAEAAHTVQSQVQPTGDVHGSAEYRSTISEVLTRRALAAAADRAAQTAGEPQ
jgi:carbon-monoxide dehydrogenase medium subunit